MIFFRVLAVVVIALTFVGCGGKSSPSDNGKTTDADAGAVVPPQIRRVLHVGLEYFDLPDSDPTTSRVSLIFTDETGATRREPVGDFAGGCSDVTLAARSEEMKPLLGLDCWAGDGGVQLRFAHRKNSLYVVSARVVRDGAAPAYQPLKTVALPQGVPVITSND